MATLRDIKRRISSVRSTQQITKAMKMVAAAKLRKAQAAILRARPYSNGLQEMLGHIAAQGCYDLHPLLANRDPKRLGLVVVSADRGLCGGFNSNIIRRTRQEIALLSSSDVSLIIVGKKAYEYFIKQEFPILSQYLDIFHELEFSHAVRIAGDLMDRFTQNQLDQVILIYNEFKSPVQQRIVVEQLLPIKTILPEKVKYLGDYIYEPSPQAILDQLCPKNINIQMWRVLLESNAAEQAARMAAMETATENARDMINELTLYYNKVRQATITRELIEVVSGAEALKE